MSKEIKVAIFVIVTALIFIFGMNFLKGIGLFDNNETYYVVFDKTNGLYESDPIVVNGYPIGKVGEMKLMDKGVMKGKVLTELIINEDVKIPVGSEAVLFSEDLLGEMSVKINFNLKSADYHQDEDTILAVVEGSIFEELGGQIEPITEELSVTLENVNKLFDYEKENEESLNYTLKSINGLLDTYSETGATLNKRLNSQMESLDVILENVESLSATLKGNEENIDEIMVNFKTLSTTLNELELKETIENVNSTVASLNNTAQKFEQTDNTIGALLNEREMYDNLEKSTESLNVLLNDVRINPKRYVNISIFGGRKKSEPKPLKPSDLE